MEFRPPVPVDMPRASRLRRARRLARTARVVRRRVGRQLLRAALRRPVNGPAMARGWRRTFEDLGGTYVKLGQLVGSAPGIFGDEVADEFRGFMDAGPGEDPARLRALIERELGRPFDECFSSLDDDPIAAASIAVVHRAALRDGTPVAVKLLRPGIEELLAADMDAVEPVLRFLGRRGVLFAIPFLQLVIGFRTQLAEEVDFRNEARSMEHFRDVFEDAVLDAIVIPRVYDELSSRRVLTMELLDGVPIDSPERLGSDAADPGRLVEQMLKAWLLTALRDGIFHADIHAGNVFLLRDGRLAMLDWGIVGRLDPETHAFMRRVIEAAMGDESAWPELANHIVKLAGPGATESHFGFTAEELGKLLRAQIEPLLTRPFAEVGLSTLAMTPDDASRIIGREVAAVGRQARKEQRKRMREVARKASRGLVEADWYRANFLLTKQVLYLERYGKRFLADVALLEDREFLRHVLAQPSPA